MTLLLFGEVPVRIREGVVIAAYTIVDHKNDVVAGTSSKSEADEKLAKYAARYPEARFRIV